MSSTPDIIRAALIGKGYSGSNNEMLLDYWKAEGATANDILTAHMQCIVSKNGALAGLPRPQAWDRLLGSLGYTGSLQEKERDFWLAGGFA